MPLETAVRTLPGVQQQGARDIQQGQISGSSRARRKRDRSAEERRAAPGFVAPPGAEASGSACESMC